MRTQTLVSIQHCVQQSGFWSAANAASPVLRIDQPRADHTVAHRLEEQFKVERVTGRPANVGRFGSGEGIAEAQRIHDRGQLAANKPIHALRLPPLDDAVPGFGPSFGLARACERLSRLHTRKASRRV